MSLRQMDSMVGSNTASQVVILTHEHTDFDALASMLAAAKLYPQAIPVLPRQMNRNLDAFLAIYRDVLPFVRLEDLPRRRIDHVILVDTQTLQPVRGIHTRTTVQVIDHHPLPADVPPGWTFIGPGAEVGATTTFLVERLALQAVPVSAIEATLLALGIYEDTGGLIYETTTPRDYRSAAWLMERGASLLVVNRYLHHPLTDDQRQLYQLLADNSQPYQFHGHSVIIATGQVAGIVEEISTLAHKLQDLYEPDGLFMIVEMGSPAPGESPPRPGSGRGADSKVASPRHIQLVARSTSDAIDVGKIAETFGGGGHNRAAAALIRDGTLGSVFEALVYTLQSHIRPTVTVAQIMSYGVPQTIAPDNTIGEAAERMRRYGFEGFPVVEAGRIVGMLTRREIDRAMHHGLDRHPVSRYMKAGEVYVTPDDSVTTLRQVMTEHDWGQVPVVDPATGQLLGIVTRTDLIKQWAAPAPPQAENLDQILSSSLPDPLLQILRQAGVVAQEMGFPLYAVGGFVRDLLLAEPNYDVDLVVEGDAIQLAQELAGRFGGRVRSHRRFGTAKWILPVEPGIAPEDGALPQALDFVTARTEFYEHPTALPTVERSSIKQDLHRRDFTINTLAVRLTPDHWGVLLDSYGGRKDLDEGIIRVLHSLSFVEDPTRILRAARFEQRFRFHIEPRTQQLIGDALDLLDRVSAERIRHEIELMVAEAEPERAFCRLANLGVLGKLQPDLRCDEWLQAKAVELRNTLALVRNPNSGQTPPPMQLGPDASAHLHLALLTHQLTDSARIEFIEKYRIRKEYRDLMLEAAALMPRAAGLDRNDIKPSEIVQVLDESSSEARLLLRVVTDSWLARHYVDQYQRRLRHVRSLLTGDDLLRLGIPRGRVYSQILERLRAARLDGLVTTRAQEENLARQIAGSSGVQPAPAG